MSEAKGKAMDFYLSWIDKEGTYVEKMLDIAIAEAKRERDKEFIKSINKVFITRNMGEINDIPTVKDKVLHILDMRIIK